MGSSKGQLFPVSLPQPTCPASRPSLVLSIPRVTELPRLQTSVWCGKSTRVPEFPAHIQVLHHIFQNTWILLSLSPSSTLFSYGTSHRTGIAVFEGLIFNQSFLKTCPCFLLPCNPHSVLVAGLSPQALKANECGTLTRQLHISCTMPWPVKGAGTMTSKVLAVCGATGCKNDSVTCGEG